MDRFSKKAVLLITLLFSNLPFASTSFFHSVIPNDLYLGLSGGYGVSEQAFENTGTSSLLRIGFGSLWNLNKQVLLGGEVGFQTGNQMRLSEKVTGTNQGSEDGVPIYLNTKTPIDFLGVAKWTFYNNFFIEGKGGAALISAELTNADIQTNNAWLPEAQAAIGLGLSDHSRLLIGYQRFFGQHIKFTEINPTQGTYQESGIPTWQAFLFTIEIKV